MNLVETPKSALARCERIIASGMESFIEVGNALAEVRDSKLYEGKYDSFDDYCEKRWEFGRHRGYLLISAAKVMKSVDNCQHQPTNEGQARELGKAPEKDRKKVMAAAAKAAPKDESGEPKITAAGIASAVEDIKAKYRKPKDDDKPADPPATENEWDTFNAGIDEVVREIKSAAGKLRTLLAFDEDKKPTGWGYFYSYSRTVGELHTFCKSLNLDKPARKSKKHPGFITARDAELHDSVANAKK